MDDIIMEAIIDDILDLRDAILDTKVFTKSGARVKEDILDFIDNYL